MDSFGDPAKLVAEDGKAFADELEQPVMDRPWFCSAYAAAGYFMCDPLTNVPKWCSTDMVDIMCPEEKGFEYTPVAGGGGTGGGGGAKRTWDEPKVLDKNFQPVNIPFPVVPQVTSDQKYCWEITFIGGWKPGERNYQQDRQIPCSTFVSGCIDSNDLPISCNINAPLHSYPYYYPDLGGCAKNYQLDGQTGYMVPCSIKYIYNSLEIPVYNYIYIDERGRILDPKTFITINNEYIIDGVPKTPVIVIPPPPPFVPVVPDTDEECATIICKCIAAVVTSLGIVNESVLKVDTSVLKVVNAITGYKPSFPEPLNLKPVTDKLSDILKAIDTISVEVVKEAGTNFWDVLGGAFKDIFDLIEFLIDKIIYLVVPEDTTAIMSAFDSLNSLISSKMKPVEQVKTAVDGAMNVQKKNFQDIYIDLPTFGRVKFFETEYIEIALPYVRRILSAMMILMTAFYAYRKVSSEMIR